MNSQEDEQKRKLRIKTGSCRRLTKDIEFYRREIEEENERIEQLMFVEGDNYDLEKQQEQKEESLNALNMCTTHLENARTELREYFAKISEDASVPFRESNEYLDAEKAIERFHF